MSSVKVMYYGLLGVCLVTLLFNIKRLQKNYYWFIPLIVLAITVQALREVLIFKKVEGYNFVFHLYQPVEYSLLALYYYSILNNSLCKKIILASIPLVLLFSLLYYTTGNGAFFAADFIDFCVCAFFVCIWVIVFFLELLRSDETLELITLPAFWINAGNLLFYGGCLMIMGAYFYLQTSDPATARELLKINHYLNLVLYSMYIIGFIQPVKWKK